MDSFNEEQGSRRWLLKKMKGVLTEKVVKNSGGLLYKSHQNEESFSLGIVPYFWYGERKYHYDIHLPQEDQYTLFGTVTLEGEISIFFKMENIGEEERKQMRKRYNDFAELLSQAGGNLPLVPDWATGQILIQTGLYDRAPSSLSDLIQK